MNSYEVWGVLLIIVAVATMVLQIRRYRGGRVTGLQLAAGLIARVGFVFLGLVYATELIDRHRRAPLLGLAVVGAGIALNLIAGVIENVRRARSSADVTEQR